MSIIVLMPLEFVKGNKSGNLLVVERRLERAFTIGAILSHALFSSVRFSACSFDGAVQQDTSTTPADKMHSGFTKKMETSHS